MILRKRFDCTVDDLDSVVVELAKEIENGYHIAKIETHPITLSCDIRRNEPDFSIELWRKGKSFYEL